MSDDEAKELLLKYQSGKCSAREKAILESWYSELGQGKRAEIHEAELENIFLEIWARLPLDDKGPHIEEHQVKQAKVTRLWISWAAAAVLLFGIVGLGQFILQQRTNHETLTVDGNIIVPGENKATLFLADHSKIELSSHQLGVVNRQNSFTIEKVSNERIAYQMSNTNNQAGGTNTLETPAGGQFQAVLPDGTKVWLNAASSITYPVSFARFKERRIKLSGEAYFEVRHDAEKPFIVETKGQITEDIGTAFNINGYPDESAARTTLIEGSVRVSSLNQDTSRGKPINNGKILRPGQQAVIQPGIKTIKVQPAGADQVLDWKNQEFVFDHQTLEEIMRKISRWYNVKIIYNKNVNTRQTFGGQVPRSTPIRQVLRGLEATGDIKFEIKGRTIFVSNPDKK